MYCGQVKAISWELQFVLSVREGCTARWIRRQRQTMRKISRRTVGRRKRKNKRRFEEERRNEKEGNKEREK
jgi:hypothetical protein